ncbi:MAG: hypothetical protein ACREBC_35625, partial [Pyrinomonadaceae bacterium]
MMLEGDVRFAIHLIRREYLGVFALNKRGQSANTAPKTVFGIACREVTRIEVSIPKRAGERAVAKGFDVESAFAATQFTIQRGKTLWADATSAQDASFCA